METKSYSSSSRMGREPTGLIRVSRAVSQTGHVTDRKPGLEIITTVITMMMLIHNEKENFIKKKKFLSPAYQMQVPVFYKGAHRGLDRRRRQRKTQTQSTLPKHRVGTAAIPAQPEQGQHWLSSCVSLDNWHSLFVLHFPCLDCGQNNTTTSQITEKEK